MAEPDPRFGVLFEPVQIGPVTARNRFFQVPHCNGMGHLHPSAHAEMRGVKAEGGWAVVCTEEVEFHHSSEVAPYIEGRIWDDADIPAHARLVDKVHEHGALAGIELVYSGAVAANLYSREPPMGPTHVPVMGYEPVQARRMGKRDIADLRRWHRQAVARSLEAGYDLVYVYAAHGLTVIQHFLSRRSNDRTDEYGGSLENRARLLREMLEDTLEETDGRAAVACRLCVDELVGDRGLERAEIEEVLGLVGELPDLWDFMVGDWDFDSITSRFAEEGAQEAYVRGLRRLTTKPVVGVGRFTSADTMVRMITDGVLDMIGSARPSIADPFLPRKIEEGRWEDIRECIGCNICVSGDFTITPLRCTQNPTMGEEWRRGWHPERIRGRRSDAKVLVVGAGPAGLEAAHWLGKRGYEVVLAEATDELGGRVTREARLPGLAAWIRVVDYRRAQLRRLANVETAFESPLDADEIRSYGFDHVAVATGSRWRADGVGRWHPRPIELDPGMQVLTPDDVMAGVEPHGERVVVFDDDHYYMGGVLAEVLAASGRSVTLVTPEARVSQWTEATMEQHRIQRRVLEAGVRVMTTTTLVGAGVDGARVACIYTEREQELDCDALLLVTARLPEDGLVAELEADHGPTVRAVGDALSPGTIAAAVWDGRRYAEELDDPDAQDRDRVPFRREVVELAPLEVRQPAQA
ncbi:MAG TPA: FAD-dependent oxidoreductase [Gaiellales bacterium]|jgi:dimethylamine/trimethylamine dehydrogenase|nr:FAD-dependent oxidoreductase [Gaiellales bacterium]